MEIINIGILAHVDAGKTSLTERILYETGVITEIGSVDKGTTRTDTLDLERARGITIKSAVVSFQLGGLKVNLIDTPGHGDFIAEVERSLGVLDAVVLVVSAVEGVQSQTRRLTRAIREAGLPMLVFVNKIDRIGARPDGVLADIQEKLDVRVVAMNSAHNPGERDATVELQDRNDSAWLAPLTDTLAESNEQAIEAFDNSDGRLPLAYLEQELRRQVARRDVVPVFAGSAISGAGAEHLLAGIAEWLPPTLAEEDAPLSAAVFKISRNPSGEKIVYVRLFAGSLAVRQIITISRRNSYGEVEQIEERITGIDDFQSGGTPRADRVTSGDIACLHGPKEARIGDQIGEPSGRGSARAFPAPKLESVVRPADPGQITHLRSALEDLAEQDPLISLRQRNEAGEISVRLFGEVQKEVMTETLLSEYGIEVSFGETQVVCIERPVGSGEHIEIQKEGGNPFWATIGLRVAPAPAGNGITYHRELGSTLPAFYRALEETVHQILEQGLYGWEVTDCEITLTEVGYNSIKSTAGDFRNLTPIVLMRALKQAGTIVCEPLERLEMEIPEDTYGAVCGAVINARGTMGDAFIEGASYRLHCEIPTAELRTIEHQLPGLTHGEGGWDSIFAGYIPVSGDPPIRKRIGPDPLNRELYLAEVAQGV